MYMILHVYWAITKRDKKIGFRYFDCMTEQKERNILKYYWQLRIWRSDPFLLPFHALPWWYLLPNSINYASNPTKLEWSCGDTTKYHRKSISWMLILLIFSFIYRTVQPERRKPHCLCNYNFLKSTLRDTDSAKIDVQCTCILQQNKSRPALENKTSDAVTSFLTNKIYFHTINRTFYTVIRIRWKRLNFQLTISSNCF